MRHRLSSLALVATLTLPASAQDVAQGSQEDGSFLERQIEGLLSGAGRQVVVTGFSGALSSSASLDSMTIADAQGVWLTLRNAELDWNRGALLRGRLEISRLTAEEILLPRLPQGGNDLPSPESRPFALPDLPVSVEIGEISAGSVVLGQPILGEEATVTLIGAASLAGGEGTGNLSVQRIDGTDGSLTVTGSYENATQALALAVQLSEPPDGIAANALNLPGLPSVDLVVDGTGTLADFAADIALATDGAERLSGQVRLIAGAGQDGGPPDRRFEADLGGDLAPVFSPQFEPFFGNDIRLQASGTRFADGRTELARFDLGARSLTLSGRVAIAADGAPRQIDVTGRIAAPEGGRVVLPAGDGVSVDSVGLDIGFDASRGPDWTAAFTLRGLETPGTRIDDLGLTGTGRIVAGNGPEAIDAVLEFAASGVDLSDPGARQALGQVVTGRARLDWRTGDPVTLDSLTVEGETFSLTGAGQLAQGQAGPVAQFAGQARAADLAAFSGLAGRPLGGAAELDVDLTAGLTSRAFAVTARGRTTDLSMSQDQIDRVFAGAATLRLDARRDQTGTFLDRLDLSSAAAGLAATARLTSAGSRADLSLTIADAARIDPRLSGPAGVEVSANGTVATGFDIVAGVRALGATLDWDGRLDGLDADAPLVSGTLTLDGADLARLADIAGRPLSGTLGGRLTGSASTDLARFALTGTLSGQDLTTGIPDADAALRGTARMTLDLARTGAAAPVEIAEFALSSDTVAASASGAYLPGQSSARLTADLPDLSVFGRGLSGPASVVASAREDAQGWAVDARAGAFGARLAYAGRLEDLDSAAPLVSGDLTLTDIDLDRLAGLARRPLDGTLSADLSGAVRADLSRFAVTGTIEGQGLRTGLSDADAALRGRARVVVDIAQEAAGAPVRVARLDVSSDTLSARATGTYAPGTSDLALTARAADLAAFGRGLTGPADLTLTAREASAGWQVEAAATALGATFAYDGRIADLTASAPLVSGRADLEGLDLGRLAGVLQRPLAGRVSARIEGEARTDTGSFDIAAAVDGQGVATGIADLDRLLRGTLAARLSASKEAPGQPIRIATLEATSDLLAASASGSYGGGQSDLAIRARLADIAPFVPEISGPVSASGRIGQANGDISVDLAADGPGGIRVTVAGTAAPDFSTAALSIGGAAPLAAADRFIAPQSLRGTAAFDLALNGRPGLGALSGTVTTQGARAVLPGPGIVLNDIAATVRLGGQGAAIDVTADKQAGGRLSVSGSIGLAGALPANLSVQLTDIVVSDPALYQTTASGALTLTGPLRGGALAAGTIVLGTTEVRVPSSGVGLAGPIPDLVHLNQPPAVRATRARAGLIDGNGSGGGGGGSATAVALDVQIVADNRIFVRGRGLDAELGGRLTLGGTTANIIPAGRFELIRGRLDILGKRLTLTEGSIALQGDFAPYLRLVAQTEANGTNLFIILEGPADGPAIVFSSQPELPEDEVLSQLLFGKSITDISPLQAARLASAVATLSGRGGDGVVGRLRSQFGLDDLDITTDGDGNAAVRAGAYLSENIYSDVVVSATGETEVNLNLDLTPSLTARGSVTTSGETSLGIFFERDY